MSGAYDDILPRAHPVSLRHMPMPERNRAAQFAPFAALSGYDGEIREAARLTTEQSELGEMEIMLLEAKLRILQERAGERPLVRVTYFEPDARKSGGAYVAREDRVKQVDEAMRVLVFTDRSTISLDALASLEGDVFGDIDDRMDAV